MVVALVDLMGSMKVDLMVDQLDMWLAASRAVWTVDQMVGGMAAYLVEPTGARMAVLKVDY